MQYADRAHCSVGYLQTENWLEGLSERASVSGIAWEKEQQTSLEQLRADRAVPFSTSMLNMCKEGPEAQWRLPLEYNFVQCELVLISY